MGAGSDSGRDGGERERRRRRRLTLFFQLALSFQLVKPYKEEFLSTSSTNKSETGTKQIAGTKKKSSQCSEGQYSLDTLSNEFHASGVILTVLNFNSYENARCAAQGWLKSRHTGHSTYKGGLALRGVSL